MLHISLPILAAWANVALLSLAGVVNLSAFGKLREIYADWDIPAVFYRGVGFLQILAAVFLATPEMRLWGILLAGPILFGSVVLLLNYRHYAVAAPVMVMMAALIVAILAVPPQHARTTSADSLTMMTAQDMHVDDVQF